MAFPISPVSAEELLKETVTVTLAFWLAEALQLPETVTNTEPPPPVVAILNHPQTLFRYEFKEE